ncbi:MAG: preprotein translocase subunit SecG [Gammaproteobacteria bacterium]|nr:preprotein translocase subunit SecG [Gammaproteobacteria bacterium]
MLEPVIIIVHLIMAIALVGLVLIQQGKGADAGASFGAGASATVFGAQGTGSFFSRLTAILAAVFFATSLGLAFYAKQRASGVEEIGLPSLEAQQAPVAGKVATDVPQLEAATVDNDSDLPVVESPDVEGDIPQAE